MKTTDTLATYYYLFFLSLLFASNLDTCYQTQQTAANDMLYTSHCALHFAYTYHIVHSHLCCTQFHQYQITITSPSFLINNLLLLLIRQTLMLFVMTLIT